MKVSKASKKLSIFEKAVGACPYCGKQKGLWFNDVPLRAFCWGSEKKPHKEWKKIVPPPANPYLPKYIK